MRLWHKDLIHVLPRQQLLAQWRECCCIARNIAVNGTPNHVLVNKMLNYGVIHFVCYTDMLLNEMHNRGYKISKQSYTAFVKNLNDAIESFNNDKNVIACRDIYADWHNDRYLKQCYYNLQEKYDCGSISSADWAKIESKIKEIGV